MLPVSVVSFVCVVIYLFFGLDIILKNRRSILNRVFLLLCLNYALMAFFSMMQGSATSLEACIFWNRWYLPFSFSSLGLLLHFHLLLCGKGKKSIPFIIAGYIPSLYFIAHVFCGGYYMTDFQKGSLGWYPATMTAPKIAVYNGLVFLLFALLELFLAFRYGHASRSKRVKRQSSILVASNLLSFIAGGLVQTTIIGRNLPLPLLPFTTMLIWIGGIWYALYRYNFLGFSLSLASPQIVSCVNELLILVDRDFNIIEVNNRFAALAGRNAESLAGVNIESVFRGGEIGVLLGKLLSTGHPNCQGEAFIETDAPEPIPVLVQCSTVTNSLAEIEGIILIAEDLRPLKRLETLNSNNEALLDEKRILMTEIHHRIKNNMNTIYGLLLLQAGTLDDRIAVTALEDASRRVQSMMLLYDKLYRSTSFTELPVVDFLSPLVDTIVDNFRIGGMDIAVEKDIGDFVLEAKTLQPLGILVNELVTNSMKYAFAGRTSGRIFVSAAQCGARVTLILADDGCGIPLSVDFEHSSGFGLELVRGLALQLGGTAVLDRAAGTKITVEFER